MRRDPELIRQIILACEAEPSARVPQNLHLEGYTEEEIGYHCHLIGDAGLAVVANVSTRNRVAARILHLTSKGHDFADASRNASIWNSVLVTLKDRALSAPISILQALLEQALKNSLFPPS